MSDNPQDDPRFVELEAQLHALLREKYHEHWRPKDGQPLNEEAKQRLSEIQTRLREAFDEIRLIDRKYKIPPLRMFD